MKLRSIVDNFRVFCTLLALACAGLLGFGYYLEYVEGLLPCPMCIFQRLCYLGIVLVALVAAIHHGGSLARGIYRGVLLVVAATGAGIAGRQTWLQHLPPEKVPECGPGLDFMLEMYPFSQAIIKALKGTGECATVDWRFLGFSIAEWSLVCFVTICIAIVLQAVARATPETQG